MAIVVEHERRRKQILEKALDVFVDEGFEDATFQKIADRCAITRTTLYAYFKNKKEIFNYSIKQLLLKVEEDIIRIRSDSAVGIVDKISVIMLNVLRHLEENRRLLLVVFDYLRHISRADADPDAHVRRRTLKLRHFLSTLVIDGIKSGELVRVNVKTANDLLYSFIEAAIFRLVVLRHETVEELKQAAALAVGQLKTQEVWGRGAGNTALKNDPYTELQLIHIPEYLPDQAKCI